MSSKSSNETLVVDAEAVTLILRDDEKSLVGKGGGAGKHNQGEQPGFAIKTTVVNAMSSYYPKTKVISAGDACTRENHLEQRIRELESVNEGLYAIVDRFVETCDSAPPVDILQRIGELVEPARSARAKAPWRGAAAMIEMHKWQAEIAKNEALNKRVHELASLSMTLNDALFRLYAHAGVPVSQMEPEQLNGALDEAAAALAKFREALETPR